MTGNPLIEAIRRRDSEQGLVLIREQPELANGRDSNGLTPLMLALYHGLEDLAESIRPVAGELDVFDAAAIGDVQRLQALLTDGGPANAWSPDGFTPLHLAAFFGRPAAARLLIERGAELETPARNEQIAAAARPLHSAVAAGQREVVEILLEAGADPNARQHGGFTPLLEAAQSGHGDIAEVLLRHGADSKACLSDGRSASDLARASGNASLTALLGSTDDRHEATST
jgi:ankyrin repeat protein